VNKDQENVSPQGTNGAVVFTQEVIESAQVLLDEGLTPRDVTDQLNIKINTFIQSIRDGKLHAHKKIVIQSSSNCERSELDEAALLRVETTDTVGCIEESLGELNGIAPDFRCSSMFLMQVYYSQNPRY